MAATISVTSSSIQGEFKALIRVHSPVSPNVAGLRHGNEALARRFFRVGGNGIFEVAEHHIDLCNKLGNLGAHFLDMRRHEMDHALQPQRQLAQRRRRADGKRLEKITRQFHRLIPNP